MQFDFFRYELRLTFKNFEWILNTEKDKLRYIKTYLSYNNNYVTDLMRFETKTPNSEQFRTYKPRFWLFDEQPLVFLVLRL
jgi:nuclear transport factor 2 (NTF2) superfamily protein